MRMMRMFFLWFGVDEICNDLLHLFQISFYSLWDLKVSTNWSKLVQIYQFLPAWYLGIGLVKLCTLTTLSVQEKQTATTQATFQIKTQTLYHCAMCKTRRNLDIFFKVFCRSSCVYMHPALGITVCFLFFCIVLWQHHSATNWPGRTTTVFSASHHLDARFFPKGSLVRFCVEEVGLMVTICWVNTSTQLL